MAQACPINFTSVDNTLSRIGSFLTVAAVGMFFLTGSLLWLYALGIDLMVRLYGNKQFSPLFQTAKGVKQLLRLPAQKVDGAAKQVAGHFGLLFILLMIAAAYFGMHYILDTVASVYVFCLTLDVLFSFCVGCKVYYLYRLMAGAV